jgi:CheY-like chemotaxis protein
LARDAAPPSPASGAAADAVVVDPDSSVCRVIALMLREVGATAVCANDGVKALELAQQHRPALLIAETRLPDMTGTDFTRRLRDLGHVDARVILMSIFPRPPIGAEDHFLQKPLRFERLLEIARECMEAR